MSSMESRPGTSGTVILVGTVPVPDLVRELSGAAEEVRIVFYGEGVNNGWTGEPNHYYLLTDVEGRGGEPFSQCLTDPECAKMLMTAGKVLTF